MPNALPELKSSLVFDEVTLIERPSNSGSSSLVRALPDGGDDNPTERSDHIFNDMLFHKLYEQQSRFGIWMDSRGVGGGAPSIAQIPCADDRPNVRVALHQLA